MVNTASKISFSRRILFLGIAVVITITTSIILFANVEAREYYSHWIISISASATAILAFLIIFQQKLLSIAWAAELTVSTITGK